MYTTLSFVRLFIFSLFLLASAQYSFAADTCPSVVYSATNKYLGMTTLRPPGAHNSSVVTATCKIWPHDKSLTIVAIAYDAQNQTDEGTGVNIFIGLFSTVKNVFVSSYKNYVAEDSATEFDENSYTIDTAAYDVNGGARAFGVRFHSVARGPSCADAGSDEALILYLPAGKQLNEILKLDLSQVRAFDGCIGSYQDSNRGENASITLSFKSTSTNGFRDIVATATIEPYNEQALQKHSILKVRKESVVLTYDGKSYKPNVKNVPWWLGYDDYE